MSWYPWAIASVVGAGLALVVFLAGLWWPAHKDDPGRSDPPQIDGAGA